MVAVAKHHLQRIAGKPWATVVAILCAILFAILAAGRGPDKETHEAVLAAFRLIDLNNSALQRDVLQTRAGLLNNYDPLDASMGGLHDMLGQLKSLFRKTNLNDNEKLAALLEQLSASIDRNETLVEQFKTKNALLHNSLSIFSKILTDLNERPSSDLQGLPANFDELGNLMLRFSGYPDADLARRINILLHSTSWANSTDNVLVSQLATLAVHGHMILMTLPSVNNIVADIQTSDAPQRAQDLQMEYLGAYSALNLRAMWSRIFLGTISIVLCIYILFLVYRLRLQTDRLTRRLNFEDVMSQIKKRFDNESSPDCVAAIHDTLNLLAVFFDATHHELIISNVETGLVQEVYENHSSGTALSKTLMSDFLDDLRRNAAAQQTPRQRFFYQNLQSHNELAFTRNAMSAGVAVGMQISARYAAMIIFEYKESRPKAGSDEVELLQHAIDLVIQCVDRVRKRHERDILEHRLEHAERLQAVGTLAGGIAHEFNNILSSMLGYGEMALQILRRPSPTRHYVNEIVSAGERARLIIDQILTLSRKRERSSRPFDMVEAVSDILHLLKVSLPESLELSPRLADRPAVVLGNPIEIQQILMNLCKNASEASPDGGKIDIEVSPVVTRSTRPLSHGVLPSGSYIRLSVTDQGEGIPDSILPHIFEPFFSTKSHAGGTGLGLAAVHGNVAALAGHINVDSAVGRGTRFDLFFPVCHQAPVPLRQFFHEEKVPYGNGQTVVILEKEQKLLMMHEEKLAALGYEPVGFVELSGILNWLQSNERRPDLVVLDVASLKDTVTLSQLDEDLSDIPYLLISDQYRTGPLSEQNLKRLGALKKPLNSKSLADAIRRKIDTGADAQRSRVGSKAVGG